MRPTRPARTLLHTALQVDAVASGAMGALLALAAGALADPLQLPEPLLRGAGIALVPFAAAVGWAGTRAVVARGAALAIVAANLLWVAASVAVVAAASPSPTPLGSAFVLAQALAVLAFAGAQWLGLRRVATVAPAT